MKKYLSFFRIRFVSGLQYRIAALAGLTTQFVWGFLLIMGYRAFYETDASAFPMSFPATVTYVWLQQAFLAAFATWRFDNEILTTVETGAVAYELVRPLGIYPMWFSRGVAERISAVLLRFPPVLLVASLLPAPFRLSAPANAIQFLFFLLTMVLGLFVVVSMTMLIYALSFYTISPVGLRTLFVSLSAFLAGGIIPLPFFPDRIRRVLEFLPFGAMMNIPFRIYSGDISGTEMILALLRQCFWLTVLLCAGNLLINAAVKRTVVQGG